MEDKKIIALYLGRNESAIEETDRKYGKMLTALAVRILNDEEDGCECVNDAYFRVWNSIPPTVPTYFSAFLHKVVRSVSIDRLRTRETNRRRASEYTVCLDELNECIAAEGSPQESLEMSLLTMSIERYLSSLKKEQRKMFLCRYYFADSVRSIADYFACSEGKVKSALFRIRCGLKKHLQQEGFFL